MAKYIFPQPSPQPTGHILHLQYDLLHIKHRSNRKYIDTKWQNLNSSNLNKLAKLRRCVLPGTLCKNALTKKMKLTKNDGRTTIHPKRWFPQTMLNFPQKDCLRTREVSRITLFAELLTVISPNFVQSLLNLSIKH